MLILFLLVWLLAGMPISPVWFLVFIIVLILRG